MGQILGAVGALPKIFIELEISYYLLKRLLGVRTEGDKKGARVNILCGDVIIRFFLVYFYCNYKVFFYNRYQNYREMRCY